MRQSGQQAYRKLDLFLCLFFIIFWIFPQIYTNITRNKVPLVPKFIAAIYSTSNLFTQANYIWPLPYIQIQINNDPQWYTADEAMFFQMPTFGYRTRLFEALYLAVDDPVKSLAVQQELAEWIAQKYESLYPSQSVVNVRFIAGLQRADTKRTFKGRWVNPSLEFFAQEDIYEISQHRIDH